MKNVYERGRKRKIKISAEPVKLVNMQGDGNCLFRAFSFVISGVQSYHRKIREKLVTFMEENACLFKGLENTSMQHYLSMSKMKDLGTWGSELEILAFASLCNTTHMSTYIATVVVVITNGYLTNPLRGTSQTISLYTCWINTDTLNLYWMCKRNSTQGRRISELGIHWRGGSKTSFHRKCWIRHW